VARRVDYPKVKQLHAQIEELLARREQMTAEDLERASEKLEEAARALGFDVPVWDDPADVDARPRPAVQGRGRRGRR
jgi:hypothetical protein